MRILAFGCHPDDVEYMSAGTLALLSERGHDIHIATMAGGEVGSPTLKSREIREKRLKEAESSARIINGTYHFAGGHDLEIEYNHEYRQKSVRIMREVNPDIVFTGPPDDYLIDHEITSKLVRNAAYIASVPLFDCGFPVKPMEKIPYLFYWSPLGLKDIFGKKPEYHFGVDITTVMETKKKMLLCHKSQDEWIRYLNKVSIADNMEELSRKMGLLIDRPYGECFFQHLGEGHPQDNILKELLGPICRFICTDLTETD
ncbi:MAG: PIG-L family deacetylase [Spirochaetes bacterium]|nr:PIG-L family deacetylase [Spirochaetota bacterium]